MPTNEDQIAALEHEKAAYVAQGRQGRADACQEQIDLLRGEKPNPAPAARKAPAKKAPPRSRKTPGVETAVDR